MLSTDLLHAVAVKSLAARDAETTTVNMSIQEQYLVNAGERKHGDSDHQVGGGERHDEPVGRRSTQLRVREDGGHDKTVADNDNKVENDEGRHRQNDTDRIQTTHSCCVHRTRRRRRRGFTRFQTGHRCHTHHRRSTSYTDSRYSS